MAATKRAWLLTTVAALAALATGAAFINLVEADRTEVTRKAALDAAITQAHRIEIQVERSLSAASILAAALVHPGRLESVDDLAAALLMSQAIESLQLAPNGIVRRVFPAEAARDSLGRNLFEDPATRRLATEAEQAKRPGLVWPSPLPSRGPTILGYLPVFLPQPGGERFWGFVLISIAVRDLLRASQLDELGERGYLYQLSTISPTSTRRIVLARSTELDLAEPADAEVRVPNAAWTLSIAPKGGWHPRSLLGTEIVLVLVATVLVALSTYHLLKEPETLRREVEVRRRRLSEVHRDLQAEVMQRRQAEERLLHTAAHDALTDLPNRHSFTSQVQAALDFIRTQPSVRIAVLFVDLDRFKYVNDGMGHAMGDRLLVEVARRLRESLRPGDALARVGGDEFAVLLCDVLDEETVKSVAERPLREIQRPFDLGAEQVLVTASVGTAVSSSAYQRAEELLRDAEAATHHAKARGRARHEPFREDMRTQAAGVLELENGLRRAIEREEFLVYYQPIISLETGRISGCEALVRWEHPVRGVLSPMEFIPIAEETGLVVWIDRWVLTKAAHQIRAWQERFPDHVLTVSVNISGRHLVQPHVVETVAEILREAAIDPSKVKLELTESVLMENAEATLEILRGLRKLGVRLLIDDFGTGYSSLAYLDRFPFDGVKIDQTFVKRMHLEERNAEIVRTISRLAQKLGMETIAEGIDTPEQVQCLREAGCEYGQGYLISRPIEAEAMERLIVSGVQL